MKMIAPDYYSRFACIKGDCRHSCCVGWEIDIDPDSLKRFRAVPGKLGARLQKNIMENEDGASFRLDADERCPFINGDGLCDLILELGEDCLCQICDDHPRFRNFFSDREEIGLGLCCEAAGRLILGWDKPVRLEATVVDDGEEELTGEEVELLELRDAFIAIVQDGSMRIEERVSAMLESIQMDLKRFDCGDWVDCLLGLERMDEAWAQRLKEMKSTDATAELSGWDAVFEQLLVYLLYRHLPGALEDDDLSGRIAYAVFAYDLVRVLCASQEALDFEGIVELCRMYSSELEYSDENMIAILERLHELNPEL